LKKKEKKCDEKKIDRVKEKKKKSDRSKVNARLLTAHLKCALYVSFFLFLPQYFTNQTYIKYLYGNNSDNFQKLFPILER
jgi:hypothetical protein